MRRARDFGIIVTNTGSVGTSYYAVVSFFAQDGNVSETKSSTTRTAVCR